MLYFKKGLDVESSDTVEPDYILTDDFTASCSLLLARSHCC